MHTVSEEMSRKLELHGRREEKEVGGGVSPQDDESYESLGRSSSNTFG